ncbi:hypothetical protein STTU_5520 [Streptomyces sp. Tu6071]|uniref:hypothetical protein n=1 Tax=Streptomyces sp. Tu6071 TaxID=355249 RepID=UPI00020E5FE1|nr:hypothetical protein [Streptomyces sp. Tu6071]EGJ78309.1 hypothetical protein STTU_5520 [Streptomyces sp. Tu6071]
MTSRIPRDSRLRLVGRAPLAAPVRTVAEGRPRRPAPRPPEGTPPPTELARAARTVLAGAAALARWSAEALRPAATGPLRTPPPAPRGHEGTLSPAQAGQAAAALGLRPAEVRAHWDAARLAGLVETHGGHARPGWRLRAWDRDDMAVLRGWVALFDAWSLFHPAHAESATPIDPTAVAEVVEAMPQLLSVLQLSAGTAPREELLDLLDQRITELRDARCELPAPGLTVPAPAPLPELFDWALDRLAGVGALTLPEGDGGDIALTPLGSWAVWVKLEQICVAAQSPAGNIEQSAEDMLRGCVRLRPGEARAEYRAWIAARTVGTAVQELLDAARGDDALLRQLAFEALRAVGAPAEPGVREVSADLPLRPYALLWLAEQEGGDAEDAHALLTREESTWLWIDTAAALNDHGDTELLVRHIEAAHQPTIPALLDEVRAAGHPLTVQVLLALAAAHPDPALAKAVRRAAFQVHTGG